ncbi:hypothetical protein F1559_002498 [Cyanidiococcus yangmingshanensis]|uniref:ABC1 atypical kinase-like domain-containing protein n=1 Tax=Cyanidiococcus yangmingshanensis TaxID=2690220 RepID=A0A7J7ICA3_9RHOD|nr:hypothetical protein F1559_002498 [Cyanidiococcus yangmingshanensis]
MDYLLPDAYCETLKPLLNACPVQEFAVVERTLCEDLRRRLPCGGVQHRGLTEALQGDIATVQFLVNAAERLFPGNFEMQWLVNEIRENLPRELDFVLERQNGDRCREQLVTGRSLAGDRRARPRSDAHVPEFLPSLSTRRVLTMSYEGGVPANDVAGIRRLGLRPRDVAYIIDDVFTDQIFCFGFVHSDPHPGNILVRPRSDDPTKPVIVLLDHGLYRELDDSFRLAYAALWQGIVEGDAARIRREALGMGVPAEDVELFTAMLTTRSWQDVVDKAERGADRRLGLAEQRTMQDKQRVQDYVRAHVMAMNRLLGRIPRPLLLLLKTNDCLRALDRRLGATAIMVEMIARKTAATLAEHPRLGLGQQGRATRVPVEGQMRSLWKRLRLSWQRLRLELRLLAFRLLVWWHQMRHVGDALLHRVHARPRSADDSV